MNYYWKNKTIYISINDFSVDFFNELPKLDIEINKNSVVFGEIIHLKIGMPKNTNKQNNEKPLIEEQYENKWKNILQIKKLAGIDVQVIQHKAKHLWQTWIVIMASRKPEPHNIFIQTTNGYQVCQRNVQIPRDEQTCSDWSVEDHLCNE